MITLSVFSSLLPARRPLLTPHDTTRRSINLDLDLPTDEIHHPSFIYHILPKYTHPHSQPTRNRPETERI